MSTRRRHLSSDDIRAIITAYKAGAGPSSIARRYGCTPAAIVYQLRRHGEYNPQQRRDTDDDRRACTRCGIETTAADMCRDCVDVESDLAVMQP